MGPFGYFRRRRERESAVESLEITAGPSPLARPPSGSFSADQRATDAPAPAGLDLAQLGQIGAMIAKAAKSGNIEVHHGEPHTIDLQGSALREEILDALQQAGLDLGPLGAPDRRDPGTTL